MATAAQKQQVRASGGNAATLAQVVKRLEKLEKKVAKLEARSPAPRAGRRAAHELKGTATVAFVDSLVARKKAKGATAAELAEYRNELMTAARSERRRPEGGVGS